MENRRYKVRLNSSEKLEELLQEIYDQACKQINEIDNEINKITNSTNLGEEGITIDEKLKYATAVHNFTEDKRKAINAKFEIAKFMGDIIKHNGDIAGALSERTNTKRTALKLDDIRAAIEGGDDADTYNLKKN
jgi:uncharacterized protein (DUF885 family)